MLFRFIFYIILAVCGALVQGCAPPNVELDSDGAPQNNASKEPYWYATVTRDVTTKAAYPEEAIVQQLTWVSET